MATSNLPIFKRVIIDDKKYLDGGAWDNCPVHMLEEKGYEDVVVIRAHKNIRIRNYKKIHIGINIYNGRKEQIEWQ